MGSDLLVIFNGINFIYIPLIHVQSISADREEDVDYGQSDENPIDQANTLSLRSILSNAKGLFSELQVIGNQSIHGYVTHILNDYFVFYSPVYKTMFIPINHLKWLIPYNSSQTPYALENDMLPVNPSKISLSRTFELQLQKLVGNIVVFDLGANQERIGQLKGINRNFVELITAKGETVFSHIQHIKSVHYQ